MSDELVERVRGHLARREIEQAFAALIERWRETRDPATADAVDALDLLEPAAVDDGSSWLVAAASVTTHRARGALLRTLTKLEPDHIPEATRIASTWQDPRLTTVVIELLAKPLLFGKRAVDPWRVVFAAATAQRDSRFLDVSELPESWGSEGGTARGFVANQLIALVHASAPAVRIVPGVIDELIGELERTRAASSIETTLLDAIYANLDDDVPRLVYADWLQQRGDPRGELIALQLRATDTRGQRQRERQLLAGSPRSWLGPLAHVLVSDIEFGRGFVVAGKARFRTARHVARFAGVREWATVERLAFFSGSASSRRMEAIYPAMTGLKEVTLPSIPSLLEVPRPWNIERLEVHCTHSEFRAVLASDMLPKLHRLVVSSTGAIEPLWLHGEQRCPSELEVFDARGSQIARWNAWLLLAAPLPLEQLTIAWQGVRNRITRDDRGRLTRLDIEVVPQGDLMPSFELVGQLAPRSLTHFDARDTNGEKLTTLISAARPARV